jgi:histidine triad (HIT) family protein
MTSEPFCIFCAILAGKAPASIVWQDEIATAFLDLRPVATGHTLIVPNRHSDGLLDLGDEAARHLLAVAREVAKSQYDQDFPCQGTNLFLAQGAIAGQTVFHTHLHVIPRAEGDSFAAAAGALVGREEAPRQTLDRLAAAFAARLDRRALVAFGATEGNEP